MLRSSAKPWRETEAMLTEATAALGNQMYVLGVRRGGTHNRSDERSRLAGRDDVVSVVGERDQVIALLGRASKEVDDPELISAPIEGIDVYVTSKAAEGKTLAELGSLPGRPRRLRPPHQARGHRDADSGTRRHEAQRGDVVRLVGRTQDTSVAAKALGVVDRATDVADVAFIGIAITIGALIGAIVIKSRAFRSRSRPQAAR